MLAKLLADNLLELKGYLSLKFLAKVTIGAERQHFPTRTFKAKSTAQGFLRLD